MQTTAVSWAEATGTSQRSWVGLWSMKTRYHGRKASNSKCNKREMMVIFQNAGVHDEEEHWRRISWLRRHPALVWAPGGHHCGALCSGVSSHHIYPDLSFILWHRRGPEDIMLGFGDHQLSYRNSPLDTHEVRLDVEEIIVHPGYRLWVQRNILQAHPSISHSRLSVSPGFLFRRRPRLLFKSLLQLGLAENDIAILKVMPNVE